MKIVENYIVAIGLSAGGLKPLHELLSFLPLTLNAAIVIVQHLHRDHKSMAAILLQQHTGMPVESVTDGVLLKAGRIYVLPENQMMTYSNGRLWLRERLLGEKVNRAIDIFMNSMAAPLGDRAIGIVLSGFDGDGSLGSLHIGEHGGITIAQLPETAEQPDMPHGAITVGKAQYTLTAQGIAELIVEKVNSETSHLGL